MNAAVIVAAGRGTRMGPNVDKLFLQVAGVPLVVHTWKRFDALKELSELVLVVRDGMQGDFEELARVHGFKKPFRLVPGGKERQDSVWNGLQALGEQIRLVAIQDGARPCTDSGLILETLNAAAEFGAAVAAQRVTDTLKESDERQCIARTVDRSRLWSVQTPQTFKIDVIRSAMTRVREQGLQVTDDTAACEATGHAVRLVESKRPNPKATSPADIPYIEWLLAQGS